MGYSIHSRVKSPPTVRVLDNAVLIRSSVAVCVVHSDRGSQFQNRKLRRVLTCYRVVRCMGRLGSSGDNSIRAV
ncbi:hypothetical protein JDV75_07670 [Corynebacterium sp. CCM 8863]|uniref:Transposase n=1 Tax=Corynebacterium meridianum TaxID=2765363 RepID=A0A934I719_9CORY|nr:hypothetical protein [Corynebacterium meridianum]